ncbi:SusC/RagA family TonB-linked outer membrane protein [Flectobacillus longus]|uniref:SusC/RagA family TonB-linked outer membrane protein n=1 Tax=Flectobacillus longus TaxID=2984207 RepID=UPI0024B74ED0|nr:SusC/RagA family TonB-linked outer membrane protein [Flectobacillus longus]MDI9882139.1 SusC/RagA family TonB-linked outer membrane protein [Flectobacillus longus]
MKNHFYRWFGRPMRQGSVSTGLLKFAAIAVAMLLSIGAYAQDKTVTGKVTDSGDGSGLPGVSVSVKGTNKGTQTDATGSFKLNNVSDNAVLVFSFVGYAKQEVSVGGRSQVNVSLASETKALEEVVVVGYGTTTKKDATGGVVALTAKDFNKGVIASPEQLLQGRAAGVQMTPNSGEPGAGINIRIRGTTSIRSGNGPLYVVDGIPLDGGNTSEGTDGSAGVGTTTARNPLNFLNPSDIENISVLKDASAAAIYGSRGANGVVLITTKKGKSGQSNLNFSANTAISNNYKNYDVLSTADFLKQATAAGLDVNNKLINAGANTNWQDQVYRTAVAQNYNLSYGGGNDNTNYFFSLGYNDQQGTIKNSGMKKVTARVNATHKLFDNKVVLAVAMTTSKVTDQLSATGGDIGFEGNVISTAIKTNPTYPVYATDGSYFTSGTPSFRNPVSLLNQYRGGAVTNRTLMNISGTWNILPNLSYKANFGYDNSDGVTRTSVDPNTPGFATNIPGNQGYARIANRYLTTTTLEHTLNYKLDLGKNKIDALAGFSYQKFENQGNYVQANYFVSPAGFDLANNINFVDNSGTNKAYSGGSAKGMSELQSYFGRVNYNYSDKYLLTATLRVDGSSKFGANNKYGYFPSFAGAWRLSNETFVPKEVFTDLKVRAGWGVTGNQEFPTNTSLATYAPNSSSGGLQKENVPNPDIKWETTTAYNIGLDFSLLKGRLSGTVDYFNKSTNNLLFPFAAPQPDVATTRWSNIPADIRNKGVEVSLTYQVLAGKKLDWEVSGNATFLKNEVARLDVSTIQTGNLYGQGLSGAFIQPITQGYPLYGFFLADFLGYDENGNTKLSADKTYKGSPFPTMTWGLNNSFSLGSWNASLFINGQQGGYVYNNTANAVLNRASVKQGNNVTNYTISSTTGQAFGDAPVPSSFYLEKSDFIRVSNFSLGYTFKLPANSFAKSLNISLTGQNLLLISNYSGLDPEVTNTAATRNGVPSLGIDYISYPKARTFSLGINANF